MEKLLHKHPYGEEFMETAVRFNFNNKTGRENAFYALVLCPTEWYLRKNPECFFLQITANQAGIPPMIKGCTMSFIVDGKTITPRQSDDAIESEYNRAGEHYYEETIQYVITTDDFKSLCDGNRITLSFRGVKNLSVKLSQDFNTWCQCIYAETVDEFAYPEAHQKLDELRNKISIRNAIFWIAMIAMAITGIVLLCNDSFFGGILLLAIAGAAIALKYPAVREVLQLFSGN